MLLLGARGARAPLSASLSSTVPGSASPKAGSVCSTSKGGDVPSPSPPFFFKTLFFFWQALLLLQRFRGYGEEIILRKSNLKQCLSTNGARLCNGCVPAAACSSARLRFRTKKEIWPPADQGRKEAGGVSFFQQVYQKALFPRTSAR